MSEIRDRLPPGYYLDAGGSWHESRTNEGAIQAVFPVMLLVVITLLMLQLRSFSKTARVVLTAPLGMIGVVIALLGFSAPMGFIAQLGIIALFGMIMRNAVILVDQIRVPLTRSELWGPMAMAIMGGLIVATLLTLLFVPALYAAWYRVRRHGAIESPHEFGAGAHQHG
jgi:multidrug efflux pump